MRRDKTALVDSLRLALAGNDPSKVEDLFPEFFAKAKQAVGPEETVRLDDFEDAESFEKAVEGKEVVYDVEMDAEEAMEMARLLGQTVGAVAGPQEGVNPPADEGWL